MNPLSRRKMLALSAAAPFGVLLPSVLAQDNTLQDDTHTTSDQMATVGIAAGQLARLSLFHHLSDEGLRPCGFEATLVGIDGKVVASGEGILIPGQGAFLDFDPASDLAKGERVQVHANVLIEAEHAKHVGGTLEVFDAKTGVTTMAIRPCGVLASLLEMGTVGLTRGQIARVNLFHHSDENVRPCGYRVDIFGLDGKLLGSNVGELLPGQGAFHDFDLAAGLGHGDRVQFHAMVTVPPEHELGMLVEGFDKQTGLTAWGVRPCGIVGPAD